MMELETIIPIIIVAIILVLGLFPLTASFLLILHSYVRELKERQSKREE